MDTKKSFVIFDVAGTIDRLSPIELKTLITTLNPNHICHVATYGSDKDYVESLIEKAEISKSQSPYISIDVNKANPEVLKRFIASQARSQFILIDDSLKNIEAANTVGMKTIQFSTVPTETEIETAIGYYNRNISYEKGATRKQWRQAKEKYIAENKNLPDEPYQFTIYTGTPEAATHYGKIDTLIELITSLSQGLEIKPQEWPKPAEPKGLVQQIMARLRPKSSLAM